MQKLKNCWRGVFCAVHPKAKAKGLLRHFNVIVQFARRVIKLIVVINKKGDNISDMNATVSCKMITLTGYFHHWDNSSLFQNEVKGVKSDDSHWYKNLLDNDCVILWYCKLVNQYLRFEVFMAVIMKNAVFLDVTPCGSCKNRRFGGTHCLLHHGDKNRWIRNNTSCN
jgi:hypothetical protein